MIGTTLGQWRILDRLGQGGMGEVFLAEDSRLGRKVALKFLPAALWQDPEAQERLRREAQSASRLDHPNIVTIFGIEESEGRPFIHMAHVPGVTLGEYAASERRSIAQILDLAIQIADGLEHAHVAGVVHRDLKPSNVLVDAGGRARILDFGIASQKGASRLTMTGFTIGTLAYAPPEVIEGHDSTPASDLYSFGVVLYQLLSGRLPFEADQDAALLYAILHTAPKPPRAHRADVPAAVERIVLRCLEKSPEKRYAQASELIADLRNVRAAISTAGGAAANERPSIAVLPFANMSADPENEFFSDGLTEELLNVLAKNPELKVTGRTSCFAFKGKHEDLREIGQKLGVATLLEGSVRKAGNRVRITAQLIQATDGFHLWSETYDRVIDDIFAVQDDIANAVSNALDVKLLGRSAATTTMSAQDYAQFLHASQLRRLNTQVASDRMVAMLEDLLLRSPNDPRLIARLSFAYLQRAGYGFGDVETELDRARVAGTRALQLDPQNPDAHSAMGWIHMLFGYRWDEAGESFRHAVALAPADDEATIGLANWHAYRGEVEPAVRLGLRAVELDPLAALTCAWVGRLCMWAGRYPEARTHLDRALDLSPNLVSARAAIAFMYILEGNAELGLEIAEAETSAGYREFTRAAALFALGRADESNQAFAALVAQGEEWAFQIASLHAFRGETDDAFRSLDRAVELRDAGVASALVSPELRSLHSDPRWPVFLAKIRLTPTGETRR